MNKKKRPATSQPPINTALSFYTTLLLIAPGITLLAAIMGGAK